MSDVRRRIVSMLLYRHRFVRREGRRANKMSEDLGTVQYLTRRHGEVIDASHTRTII
jgi:hypothetical protein